MGLRLLAGLCLVTCILFLDTCSLTAEVTQVVKLCAADASATNNVDMINNCRVQREDAFDADAEADLADGDRLTGSAVLAGDADALKDLEAFLVAFLDADVHLEGVARGKSGNVIPQLCILYYV